MSERKARALRREVRKQLRDGNMTPADFTAQVSATSTNILAKSLRPKPRACPKWWWLRRIRSVFDLEAMGITEERVIKERG